MSRRYRDPRVPIVTLLFLGTVINYVDRQVLSVNAPLIRDQLGLSNFDYSGIVFAFLLAYTVMQAGSGFLIDRLGTRRGFALSIIWWSIAGMMHAGAASALGFALVRFLLGMGEAGNWPGAMRAVAEWFPARHRAFAAGIFGSGTSVGAMIAPPIVVFITLHFGWQAAFLVTGATGFLWLIAWLRIYWPPAEHPRLAPDLRARIQAEAEPSSAPSAAAFTSLLRQRKVWGVILARMCADPVWWFYVFWLPEYLTRARGYSFAEIGYLGWIPFLAADIGNVGGGFVSSHLIRRGFSLDRARKTVLYTSALGMTAALPAVAASDPVSNLALICLATLSFGSWATNMLTVSADVAPPGSVGSVTGLAGMGAGVGGMLFTLATGFLVDRFGYPPVFVAAGILPLLAALSVAAIVRRIERVDTIKEP